MGDAQKPAMHGRDHRDTGLDKISGEWFIVLDAGADPPDDPDAVEDVDYLYFQNGALQPPVDVEQFSFRRGLSWLDTKGVIDIQGFSSGDVAFTLPTAYRFELVLPVSTIVLDEDMTTIAGAAFVFDVAGDVRLVFPL